MANPIMDAVRRLPRTQQLAIGYGIPVVIIGTFGWFTYQDLGEIGPHHEDPSLGLTHADVRLPSFLNRTTEGSLGSEAAGLVGQIAAKQATINRRPAVEREKKAVEAEKDGYERQLPTDLEKAEMRRRIEDLARGAVTLESVKIIEPVDSPRRGPAAGKASSTRDITFVAEIKGSFNGIIKYIDAIERSTRFMSVRTITIKPGSVSAPKGSDKPVFSDHSARIEILTHIYTKPDAPGVKR